MNRKHETLHGWEAFKWWWRGWFGWRKFEYAFKALTYWYCPHCGTGWRRKFFRGDHLTNQLNYCMTCLHIENREEEE